ncbi:GntR family transcriptional regulator [uncultured Parolsenella sp.]|uniref:GntR family transcriptional regulator n=1 Tax=uncultured Parolsenella sp. TaxID=2083008 RepID=UPI0025FB9636|nr:GntR family transcriptional regulator [uncultured Parolsenella sp.]
MDVILSNSSDRPIYEQISSQVRAQILSGALAAGERLPSIRALADGLGVSAITTKRACSDLEAEGLISTVPGRGTFVSKTSNELLRERRMRRVEELLGQAAAEAAGLALSRAELHEMLDLVIPSDIT